MIVKVSPQFKKNYRHLSENIKQRAKEKEQIFRENCFSAQLKTHKLSGKDKGCWAFSINDSYRIKFIFLSPGGPHSVYK